MNCITPWCLNTTGLSQKVNQHFVGKSVCSRLHCPVKVTLPRSQRNEYMLIHIWELGLLGIHHDEQQEKDVVLTAVELKKVFIEADKNAARKVGEEHLENTKLFGYMQHRRTDVDYCLL